MSCALVAVTAISFSACKKQQKENLKIASFDAPVSINHYEVETYLNYTGNNHVGEFLPLTPNYRHDQGKPVTVSYELPESCKNEIIEKTEISVYTDETCKNLVQTANNSNREAYIDVYNLIPETTYYFKVSAKMSGGKTFSGTGTFSALLQGLLGLSPEDIIRDYELSAFYHNYSHVNRYAKQENSSIVELIEALNEFEGETFSEKVANFLKGVGITDEQINTIKTIFLED